MKWLKLKSKWKNNEIGKVLSVEDDAQAKALVDAEIAEEIVDPTADIVKEAGEKLDLKLKSFGENIAKETITKYLATKGGNRPQIETHDNELDDPKLGFKSASEFWFTFAQAQRGGEQHDVAKKRLFGDDGYVKKMAARVKATGQNEAIDSEGGIFVIPEFSSEILMISAQLANLRKFCRGFNMTGTSYSIRARVDKNHSTSVAGGITVGRKPEASQPDKSKAKFEWINFKPTKLTGYTAITDEQMEDAAAFATLFPPMFGEAMASAEESDFLIGAGAGEPLGAFHANNPARLTVNKETGQTTGTLNIMNVLKMRAACYGYSKAVWLANQDIIPQLATFVIGTVPVFQPSVKDDVSDTLLGRPILFTEHCETTGTQGDIRLMGGSEYGIADRGGLNSATSIHVKFLEGESVLKFWRRGDGQPLWSSTLTPVKGSQRSPFVDLQTR
jgi:HK97 family phage major capsid protein